MGIVVVRPTVSQRGSVELGCQGRISMLENQVTRGGRQRKINDTIVEPACKGVDRIGNMSLGIFVGSLCALARITSARFRRAGTGCGEDRSCEMITEVNGINFYNILF